jgi:ornithine--oxo-acid transaminase
VRGLGLLNAVVIDEDACNAARAARGQDVAGNKRRTAWQFCLLLKARGVLAKTTHGNV